MNKTKIIALIENTSVHQDIKSKHGLSLYIETNNQKILFDVGPNALFIDNARKLGIDLAQVDTVIISHGHSDHGGGLEAFLAINQVAKVYIQRKAFDAYYTKVLGIKIKIGLKSELKNHPQVILLDDDFKINKKLQLFRASAQRTFDLKSNNALLKKEENKLTADDFLHEQSLYIKSGISNILISGCSHSGIVDIQESIETKIGQKMDYVIGGFHIFNPISKVYEKKELIEAIGKILSKNNSCYYTCHCTGAKGFALLEMIMKDKIKYLSSGMEINI